MEYGCRYSKTGDERQKTTEHKNMVLYETIPPQHDIDKCLPGGDEHLYRACAAFLVGSEDLLDSEKIPRRKVEECLAFAMSQ